MNTKRCLRRFIQIRKALDVNVCRDLQTRALFMAAACKTTIFKTIPVGNIHTQRTHLSPFSRNFKTDCFNANANDDGVGECSSKYEEDLSVSTDVGADADCDDSKPTGGVCSAAPFAPIDINGWEDEEDMREGTVEYECIEKMKKFEDLPAIPTVRTGVYRFKGITVILPQAMLTPATYKYRFSEDDDYTPDDTRICSFTPIEGVPVNEKE